MLFLKIAAVVVLNSAVSVFLKLAAVTSGGKGLLPLLNGWLLLAFLCLGASFLFWQSLLGKKPLSWLHPFCSLPLAVVPIPSYFLFGEQQGLRYFIGVALILAGIYLTSSGVQSPDGDIGP